MQGQLRVEPVGELIIARVWGEPTEALLRECQERVLSLARETGHSRVLYDALEMESPPVDVPLSQRTLDQALGPVRLRRACLVSNTRIGYLARLAFGEDGYRIFYNDILSALLWLNEAPTGRGPA